MSEIQQNKPCVLFMIPPADDRLDDYRHALEAAGYEVCLAQYGKASREVETGKTWDWIVVECPNPAAVIWPGEAFCDAWMSDEISNAKGRVSEIVAKLVARGAAEFRADFDYGGAFDDKVVMYGSAEVFAQEVTDAIQSLHSNNHGRELK